MIPVKIKPISDDEQDIVVNNVTGGVSYISSIEDYSADASDATDSVQLNGTSSAFAGRYLQNPAVSITRTADSGYISNTAAMSVDPSGNPAVTDYSLKDLLADFGVLISDGLAQAIDDLQNNPDFYETFYAEILNQEMQGKLVLTPDEITQLQTLATEGDIQGLKDYLLAIAQKLTTGSYFTEQIRSDLRAKLLLSDDQVNQIEELFNEGRLDELKSYLSALADNIENTYFTVLQIRSDLLPKLLLSTDQQNHIIELGNEGRYDELRSYLKSIADSMGSSKAEKLTKSILNQCAAMDDATLTKALFTKIKMDPFDPSKDYGPWGEAVRRKWSTTLSILRQCAAMDNTTLGTALFEKVTIDIWDDNTDYGPWGNDLRNKIRITISMLKQCAAMDDQTLLNVMFVKTATDYLVVKLSALEEVKARILWYVNLQRLMTMLVDAKHDGYNAVLQIMEEQTGYQSMNIEKLNTRQADSLGNFISTRKQEIYDYVNKHNDVVKAEQEKEIQEQQNNQVLNFIFSLGLGIISFIASLIAAIFTAGLTVPLALSAISTTVEVININRQAESDITVKKKQEKLEEDLALLRAAELKQERDFIEKRLEELKRLRQEAQGNQEYQDMLDLEILANTSLLNSNNVFLTYNGFTQFAATGYLRDSLRVQALSSYMNIYTLLKKAKRSSRDLVAEELALPAAGAVDYSGSIVNETASSLQEHMTSKGQLEFEKAQLLSSAKELREEIKKIDLTRAAQIISKVIFQVVDIFTFGLGSSALRDVFLSTGSKLFDFMEESSIAGQIVYNDVQPGYFTYRGQAGLEDIYSGILADTGDLSQKVSPKQSMLNYDLYLGLLKKLELVYLMNTYSTILLKSIYTGRSIIHQTLTDVKAQSVDFSNAEIAFQQRYMLLKDILQKQVYLTNDQINANNQKIQAQNELAKSGWAIIFSALSGVLGGWSSFLSGKGKKTEAFASNLLEQILNDEQGDLLDLLLPDSDLNLRVNTDSTRLRDQLGNTEVDEVLQEILQDDLFVSNGRGETIADLPKLAAKYQVVQRILIINQVLADLLAAKQKARDLVHMEMAEQSLPALELSKKQAAIAQEEIQDQWDVLTERFSTLADWLSRKNIRQTEAQRNFLSTILSVGLGGLVFAGTGETSFGDSLAQLVKVSLNTGFLLQDMTDNILENYLALSGKLAENKNAVNEQLLLSKLEAQEQQLLLQAMAVKQNTGNFGLNSPNLSQLEHINYLLRKLKMLKDRIISIKQDELGDRSLIHSILTSIAGELNLTAVDVTAANNKYLEKLADYAKRTSLEKAQVHNSEQRYRINSAVSILDNSLSGLMSITPFVGEDYQANFNEFVSVLHDLLPALQAAVVFSQLGGTSKAAEEPGLSELDPAGQEAVRAADLQEDTMLLEETLPLLETARKLVEAAQTALSKIAVRKASETNLYAKLAELLQDSKLQQLRQFKGKTTEQILAELKTAFQAINKQYAALDKLMPGYNAALKLLEDAQTQQSLNQCFNNGLSFDVNFNNYLAAADQQAADITGQMPAQYAEALQNIRSYISLYKEILQESILIAGLHENRAAMTEIIEGYRNLSQLYGGQAGKEYQALMLASSFYERFIGNQPQVQALLDNPTAVEMLLQNPENNPVSLSVTLALYRGVSNYQDVNEQQAAELAKYHGELWRMMYNIQQKNSGSAAGGQDVAGSWARFFEEASSTADKYQQYGENLDQDYQQACQDLAVVRDLFNNSGLDQKINILVADLSPEVKLHISEMAGNNITYNDQLRKVILAYLENKVSGLEIKLLDRQTDLDFAQNMLAEDWTAIKQLQQEYDKICLEYEQTVRNNPDSADLARLAASAAEYKQQLETKEKLYKEKSAQYLQKIRAGQLN